MARLELEIETKLPPDKVMAALTDFSNRRPDVWPDLAREYYKVYSVGEKTADVREGSVKPMRVWAREHYDWSTPGTVTWTVKESNFCRPGSHVSARASPKAGGGSRVQIVWDRTGSNLKGKFIVFMMRLMKGKPIMSSYKNALDKMAERPL